MIGVLKRKKASIISREKKSYAIVEKIQIRSTAFPDKSK